MKSKFKKFLLLFLIITLVFGCGKSDESTGNTLNNKNISDKTKVSNLSESYIKYAEIKSSKLEAITELTEQTDNYMLGLALIPLGMSDLAFVPASVCGLEETEAVNQLFLYENISYKKDGDKCTIIYEIDGEQTKFIANYDKKTDSVTMDIYEENELTMTSEYIKIKDGYASQLFTKSDEGSNYSVYKTKFQKDDIYTSIYENTNKPASIFKNSNISDDFAKNGDYLYISIVGGVASAIIEGETVNFNTSE